MLPHHSFPQLVPNRTDAMMKRLEASIWHVLQPLDTEATTPAPQQRTLGEAALLPRTRVQPDTSWGMLFDQRWCRIVIPPTTGDVWLNWRDQGEATLYISGFPHFGFDVAHRHCRIPGDAGEIWLESNAIQSAIWHPEAPGLKKGSLWEGAWLCRRNDDAWKAFHDVTCLYDLATFLRKTELPGAVPGGRFGLQPSLEKASPVLRCMLRLLDEAADAYDLKGLTALLEVTARAYEELRMPKTFTRAVMTGHAHIDLVWLWPERMGESKALHTFSSMNWLMDEYPEFRFSYSQPASYEAIQRRNPALYRKVKERIAAGTWQATGAMYVESDTLMACGEALVRSFVLGQQGFTEINGAPSRLTWLPDVFGYSVCLPQIMKQAGVEYFFTTKMTWNAINRFPHSSFVWRGNDGSEVLAHVTQDGGYNAQTDIAEIRATMNGHQQSDVHAEYLMPTGFGDGGGGTTAFMCERARRLNALPGMPAMGWDQPEAFFDRLAPLKSRLPVHQGECYLEYHRGTFTTHGNLKATFRSLERALHAAEAVASVTGARWDMVKAWKRLIFSQFHDYIPGSSVWDVYLEGLPELAEQAQLHTRKAGEVLEGEAGQKGAGKSAQACLFNQHALPVKRWVQDASTGKASYVALTPLGSASLKDAVAAALPSGAQVPVAVAVDTDALTVSNGITEFRLNSAGWIDRLVLQGHSVPLAGGLGQLVVYPDRPADFDAWDIDRHVLSLGVVCDSAATISAFQNGEHSAGLRVTRRLGSTGASSATVTFALSSGSGLVDITVDLDWQEPEHLLKLRLPTQFAAVNARFGAPYGSVLRSQVPNSMVAEAMWEVPFSRYLAVFDEGERDGLFVATECKYGAYVKSGEIGLSLVRSPRVPGFESHRAAWPPHLSRLTIPGPYSDIGAHSIRLTLGHYDITAPREQQAAAIADTHFSEPLAYVGAPFSSPLKSLEGGNTLVPAWAMPSGSTDAGAGDGTGEWILRLHETSGCRGELKISAADGWKLEITDIAEKKADMLLPGGVIAFTPYQIISVRFRKA